MLKTLAAAAAVVMAAASSAGAVTFHFSAGAGDGFGLQTLDTPDSFTLELTGNDNNISHIYSQFTTLSAFDAVYDVSWAYVTADSDGPSWDPFGFLLDGVFTELSNDAGPDVQNGTFELSVGAGQVFGFFVQSADGAFGAASATVTGVAAVPLPASGLLLFGGMGALIAARRRRASAA